MPMFTIETSYRLSVYRQANYEAGTIEEARRLALADDDWSGERLDYETSGETTISGVWLGADSAYRGADLPVPEQFGETFNRSLGSRLLASAEARASNTE